MKDSKQIITPVTIYLPAVDARCPWCGPGQDSYRMTGRCTNCGKAPVLGIFTSGHEARGGTLGNIACPACGVCSVLWQRLAGEHELPVIKEETHD